MRVFTSIAEQRYKGATRRRRGAYSLVDGESHVSASVPILLYHSIDTYTGTNDYKRWAVSPAVFDAQMKWLSENDYRPVTVSTLASLYDSGEVPPRTVAVTFDDGLRDFLTGALPILERYGFAATLYVVTQLVGATSRWLTDLGEGNRPMLTWDEVRLIADHGLIECGAHTLTHPELDILSPRAAGKEIRASKAELEEHLGRQVGSFAYPHGYSSPTTRRLAREAGFTSACRVRHAISSPDEDRLALSRIIMTSDIDTEQMGPLLTGETGLPVAPPVNGIAMFGWRVARYLRHSL